MTNVEGTGYYVAMLTTYILVIGKRGLSRVRIGRQRVSMEEGLYLYVGSAKRGLDQRLARHVKKRKTRFWHVDYITCRRDATVLAIYLAPTTECETLSIVSRLGTLFGRKLGSSDCTCQSHFVQLNQVSLDDLRNRMAQEGFVEALLPMLVTPAP